MKNFPSILKIWGENEIGKQCLKLQFNFHFHCIFLQQIPDPLFIFGNIPYIS